MYLVGGAVRDLLRGVDPLDLDLVVDGELEPVSALLGTPARVHDRFETRAVTIGGFTYDLARARRERYAHPGALPTVGPAGTASMRTCERRDFTVNALALGLAGPRRGHLLDVPHAREDLNAGRLRVLHDHSFIDDPTRLLRLARYAGRLGFAVEDGTRALVQTAVAAGRPQRPSGPRLGAELRLLGEQGDPVEGFGASMSWGSTAACAGVRRSGTRRGPSSRGGRSRCCPAMAAARTWCWRWRRSAWRPGAPGAARSPRLSGRAPRADRGRGNARE